MNEPDSLVVVEFDPGTRSSPPEDHYAAPVRLDGEDIQRTLVLEFVGLLDNVGWRKLARASFLVPDSPHERLAPPTTFELMEGPHVVATGEVLTASQRIPGTDIQDTDTPDAEGPRKRAA